MAERGGYEIREEDGVLLFETESFEAGKGSMLHSGIYNRELSSILFAATVVAGGYLLLGLEVTLPYFVAGLAVFAVLFVLARFFIFFDKGLQVVLDRGKKEVLLKRRNLPGRTRRIPFESISRLETRHVKIEPVNPDGVRVIERIALQHGTVIPGFGETENFHVLDLVFTGSREAEVREVIFTSNEEQEAAEVRDRLLNYIEGA